MKNKIYYIICLVLCLSLGYGLISKNNTAAEPSNEVVPTISDEQNEVAKKIINEISDGTSEAKYYSTIDHEYGKTLLYKKDGVLYEVSEDGKKLISMSKDENSVTNRASVKLTDEQLKVKAKELLKTWGNTYENYRITKEKKNKDNIEYEFTEYLKNDVKTGAYLYVRLNYSGKIEHLNISYGNPSLVKDKNFAVNKNTVDELIKKELKTNDYIIIEQATSVYYDKIPIYIVKLESNNIKRSLVFNAETKELIMNLERQVKG